MMEVEKASQRTTLRLGRIEVPVGLFKVDGDAPRPVFEKVVAGEEDAAEASDPLAPAPARRVGPTSMKEKVEYRRGVRKPTGEFVDLTDELTRLDEELKGDGSIEVLTFVDRRSIPRERIRGAYYVGCSGGTGPKVLRLLEAAMSETNRAAVVRWTKRKNATLGVLATSRTGALVALELLWGAEVRRPNDECVAHTRMEVSGPEIERARELIGAMAGKREDLDGFADPRWAAEYELVARAEEGELDDYVLPVEEPDPEMADLEALLDESLAAVS